MKGVDLLMILIDLIVSWWLIDLGYLGFCEEIYKYTWPVHVTRARPTPPRIQIIWQYVLRSIAKEFIKEFYKEVI